MNCHQMEPKIYSYLQGELSEKERSLVADHLSSCNVCQANYLEWLQVDACFDALEFKPPEDFTLQVMEAIKARETCKDIKKFWLTNWYRNVGKGLIAAGILGIIINCSALLTDIPLDKSAEKAFL